MTGPTSPGPETLLQQIQDSPLDWFANELVRLRACATNLTFVADAPAYKVDAMAQVIQELRIDLPRLLACEGTAVLPILRLAAHRDDDIETADRILTTNHRILSGNIRQILVRLEAFRIAEAPLNSDRRLVESLYDLAARLRSHLALTAAVILPIARLRFKPADLELLASELGNQPGVV